MNPRDVEVIAPNFKRRLSGVTSTIVQLVPEQSKTWRVAVLGPGLPDHLPRLRWRDLPALWRRPATRPFRIWHARRNVEMLGGLVLRDLLRMRLRLVFTSASQRRHTAYTRWLIARMDAVIATSARTGAYLDVPHEAILHGIDLARFRPPESRAGARDALGLGATRRLVGCFGRVRHQKGTDLFVDAMIAVLPSHPGWSAVIAGRATGPHLVFEAELRRRVEAAGLADRILFVGEHRNIADWYRALDLFVAPQRWEGFGLTPLEAMATGVPVIATDVGAFPDILGDGLGGVLVPADDPEAMIAAARRLMTDDACLARAAGEACSKARDRFPLAKEAAAIGALYERLWAAKSAR